MIDWGHSGPAVIAAFLASLVEFAAALTIVLAVGVTRGWRRALIGTSAGHPDRSADGFSPILEFLTKP
jgi:hypothetical protein